ncbi:peroxidase 5-like [Nymphaea colorata]|nr:peroxidase 5-like [Nymphaea colorata]
MKGLAIALVAFLGLMVAGFASTDCGLQYDYYHKSCPQAEQIIATTMDKLIKQNFDIVPNLVRMHFHDCFVRGCDASILLNSTKHNVAEKDSPINNPSLGGFDVIDKLKEALEVECPRTVSCADIITFATREAIHKAGSDFPRYEVRGGRKDGRVSLASETITFIPPPTLDVSGIARFFGVKGLTLDDAVTLLGAHSIGDSHCSAIGGRERNFKNTGKPDPTLDPKYAAKLRKQCPASQGTDPTVSLDPITPDVLDNKYYVGVLKHLGLFTSDATLLTDEATSAEVHLYAYNPAIWRKKFVAAIIKMGEIQVKTGDDGEVRKNCALVN